MNVDEHILAGVDSASQGAGNQRHLRTRQPDLRGGNLRLAIAIPAVLVLFTVASGLVSLKLLDWYWLNLEQLGAREIAAKVLRGQLYGMLILTGVALLTGLGLSVAILRPIRAIHETAQRVARGDLELRAPQVGSAPELGDLSRSFNRMIEFVNDSIVERNRYLIEGIVTGILTSDRTGKITALNSTGASILGLESTELVGRSITDLRQSLPWKYRPIWDYIEGCLNEERAQTLQEIVLHHGTEPVSLMVAMSLLRDGAGHLSGVMLNFRDSAEIRSLTEQLQKTDQLAALGTFTMGLAHELRNPLGSIKGIIQLLKMQGSLAPEPQEYMDRVVVEVNRLDGFIRELFDFCNQTASEPISMDLNDILIASLSEARGTPNQFDDKRIEVAHDLSPLPPVLAEPERLRRAFGNIIRNAYEAAAPGSKITLRTHARREGADDFAVVYVHNTGSTIPPEDMPRIFDPFFSTREKGTGLGLAIAYQVITQQRGTLNLSVGPNGVAFIARFKVNQRDASSHAGEVRTGEEQGSISRVA